MTCKVSVVKGDRLLSYSFPPPHPFTSERAKAFWEALEGARLGVTYLEPVMADEKTLELFHTKEHLDFVRMASSLGYGNLDEGDTPAFPGVFEAAQFAVGSTIACVADVVERRTDHALNPVGGLHHARRDSSAGFCVFNDIGVAVEVLRREYGVRRVLYVDIDVHHGDGVYYSYEADPELLIFDVHEDGRFLYPGTGEESEAGVGPARGTKVNVPVLPLTGDDQIVGLLPRLEALARRSSPEFIMLQCGADGLEGDPIGGLAYTAATHRVVSSLLHRLSHELCAGRIVALGGGGYRPENCAAAWLATVKELLG